MGAPKICTCTSISLGAKIPEAIMLYNESKHSILHEYKSTAHNFFSSVHILHFFFHLIMFCTHNLLCYEYLGPHNVSGSMCQGSWSMLHTPSTPNMPKTCMAWTQIMSRNAKGAFHLGPWALPSRQRMRASPTSERIPRGNWGWASPTSERIPRGNWGCLTQHNFSCSLLEQDLPCELPRAGHKVIWTVRSPHWFRRGRHKRRLSPWTLGFAFSSQDDVFTNRWEVC
jgi:hypothetical protein